jgi:hypothetical protein
MSFSAWCLCQSFDLRQRLQVQQQAFLRRLFAAEARDRREATINCYIFGLPQIDQDILAGKVDA